MSKVFKAIGNAISGVVKAVVGVVKAVVGVVGSVLNFLTQPFMGPMDMPNAGQEAQRQDGVLVQRQGSNVNIPVVYGMRKVGGIVTYAETGSSNNQYLWVAYVFSEGLVEGLRELYIDDYQIDNATITNLMAGEGNIVAVGEGKYAGRVQLQFFPGVYYDDPVNDSVVPSRTLMADAPSWKDSMYYNGLAVLFARFYWRKIETQADADSNPFTGSIPEVKATLLGKKVASLVVANPGQYEYGAAGYTERYSTNPAEILLDYLRNPRYGKGLVNADIDFTTWKKAAIKCNQEVTYTSDIKGPIMTCNYVLDTGQSLLNNTKSLLQGFRSYMPYVQGKYKLKVEDAGDPDDILSGVATIAATFTPDNIQGDVQFTGIDKSAKYTSVAVTYVDPDNKYSTQQVIYPESESDRQTYIVQDGGRENKLESTFGTITNYAIAKDFARMLFNKSRRQESCTLTVSSQALELEPGDCIRIQSNILDFSTDPWRIISFKLNDDMTVQLSCVRNPDDIYPHTRVGEEDIVLPVFVPKGASIYYPTSNNALPIGLVPPAYVPGYNQTNPNTSSGGGVGGSGGSINIQTPSIPPVEIPLTLTDTIDIQYIRFTVIADQQLNAILEFTQPSHAMYESVELWYRGLTDIGYKQAVCTFKPGAGQLISFTLPEAVINNRAYEVISRVRYSTGEKSQAVNRFNFNATSFGDARVAPDDNISIIEPGWSLPIFVPALIRNNRPGITYANAATSGSARRLNFQIQENCLSTVGAESPNPDIVGVIIYWRQTGTVYWYEQIYRFPSTYRSGDIANIVFDGNIGNTGDLVKNYDFIVRYYYNDTRQSTRQRRYMNVDVTYTGNFYGVFIPSTVSIFTEEAGAYELLRVADNPGAVGSPKNLTVGIRYVFARSSGLGGGNVPTVRFGVIPTASANLVYYRGLRLYWRKYDPFSRNNPWQSADVPVQSNDADGLVGIPVNVDFNFEYDWILVPLVRDGSSTVESDKCWTLTGKPYAVSRSQAGSQPGIPSDTFLSTVYGEQINYKSLWTPVESNTNEALNRIQAVKAQVNPTAQIIESKIFNTSTSGCWTDLITSNALRSYYKLVVNIGHIGVSFHSVRFYRRSNHTGLTRQTGDVDWGLGRWEYITRTAAQAVSGNITVYLRPPTHFYEYNRDGSINNLYNNTARGVPISAPNPYDEILIVVYQDTGSGAFASAVVY